MNQMDQLSTEPQTRALRKSSIIIINVPQEYHAVHRQQKLLIGAYHSYNTSLIICCVTFFYQGCCAC